MKKNARCYGRQTTIVPKEKSFIKNFFDGNGSSDDSLFSADPEKRLDEDSNSEDNIKEDRILHSPSLFQSFHQDSTKGYSLEQNSLNLHKIKKVKSSKRFKYAKQKRNIRKKPKLIQHLSTKFCKSFQPCWSDFYSHDFIVEKNDQCYTVSNPKELVDNNYTSKTSPPKKLSNYNKLNSSGELFEQSCKKRKNAKKKKNLKQKHTAETVSSTSEQENIIDVCQKLADLSSSFKKCEDSFSIKDVGIQHGNRKTTSGTSCNVLSDIEASKIQTMLCKNTKGTVQNFEKVNQKNKSISVSTLKSSNPPNFDINLSVQKKIQIPDELHSNISQEFINNANYNNSYSLNHLRILPSKSGSGGKESENFELNHCDFSTVDTSSQNSCKKLNLTSSCTLKKLKLPGSLLSEIDFSNRKDISINNSNLYGASDRELDFISHSDKFYKNPACLQFDDPHCSCEQPIVIDDIRKGNSPKISYTEAPLYMNCYSPDMSNIFLSSESVERKLTRKYVTSTPVTKFSKSTINSSHLTLFSNGKIKSAVSNFHRYNSPKESIYNFHQNSLLLSDITKISCQILPVNFSFNRTSLSNKKSGPMNLSDDIISRSSRSVHISTFPEPLSSKNSDEFMKAKLLKLCNQESVVAFASIYDWKNFKVKKIGEGTYGEVFQISKGRNSSVLKVIAVSEGNNRRYQSLKDVLAEVQISKCLSELRNNKRNQTKNFIKVIKVSIVSGSYPNELIVAWDNFYDIKSCYNDRPDDFDDNQLFVILELEYGGKDMASFVLRNSVEGESVLKQVAVSLAVAEEEFLFEHRDLHLGNILVQRNRKRTVSYKLRGKAISFDCHGLQVTMIDFTLSRLYTNGFIYYNDLAEDLSLFEQNGDYQFEVYQNMKECLMNQWHESSLYSNVLWLKYLCQKLIEFNYSRPSTLVHKKGLKCIESFNSHLMDCNCAVQCLTRCGITDILFEKIVLDANQTKQSILVSRNSSKNSKLSMCN